MRILVFAILLCWCLFSAPCAIAQPTFAPQPKSTSTGLQWAVGATVIPAAIGGAMVLYSTKGMGTDENQAALGILLGTLGLVFGPGAGHAYAGRERPMKGAWLRTGGLLIGGLGGMGAGISASFGNDISHRAILFIVAGGVMTLTSATIDIATTGRSVDEYNRKHGFSRVQVQPWYHCSKQAAGLALTLNL